MYKIFFEYKVMNPQELLYQINTYIDSYKVKIPHVSLDQVENELKLIAEKMN